MSLWGASTTDRKKPLFQANTADPARNALANTYATNTGWEYLRPDGTKEIIVAVRGLAGLIGNANITQAYFESESALDANATSNVVVVFNEEVYVLGTTPPKVNLTSTGSNSANVQASYVAGNGTNRLVFQFTTLNDFAGNTTANVTLTLANQVMLIAATNNIVDKVDVTGNASRSIPYYTGFEYGANGAVPSLTVTHNVPSLANMNFAAATLGTTAASNVFANFTGTVYINGADPRVLIANVANPAQNITAAYASGNGTSNLRFSWTSTSANTLVLANTISLVTTGKILDSAGAGVANTITASMAANAGNVIVS